MRVLFRSAAAGDDVAHGQQGLVQQRQGLLEVDDVHAVAGPENERGHARVPAAGGMSKVDASFEELTQRGARKRHETFSGWSTAGLSSDPKIEPQGAMILWISDTGATVGMSTREAAMPACEVQIERVRSEERGVGKKGVR